MPRTSWWSRLGKPQGWKVAVGAWACASVLGAGGAFWLITSSPPGPSTAPAPSASPRPQASILPRPSAAPRKQVGAQAGAARKVAAKPGAGARAAGKPARKTAPKVVRKARPQPPVVYRKVAAAGVPLHVVYVDPRNKNVRIAVGTAAGGVGTRETWSGMIGRARPAAAITGTYFCTESMVPIGSIVVGGQLVHNGLVGTAFTFAPGYGAQIFTCKPYTPYNWSGFETVLRAGPRLLTAGKVSLYPQAEGFRDPAVYARKKRTAVAVTRSGKLLLVASPKPVLLREFAAALRALGAADAMCLDGGDSSGLYHRGKSHLVPQRTLTNLLLVYDSAPVYRHVARSLNPGRPRMALSSTGRRPG